jgi:hypothetical protein
MMSLDEAMAVLVAILRLEKLKVSARISSDCAWKSILD